MTAVGILTWLAVALAGGLLFALAPRVGRKIDARKRDTTMPVVALDLLRVFCVAALRVVGVALVLLAAVMLALDAYRTLADSQ